MKICIRLLSHTSSKKQFWINQILNVTCKTINHLEKNGRKSLFPICEQRFLNRAQKCYLHRQKENAENNLYLSDTISKIKKQHMKWETILIILIFNKIPTLKVKDSYKSIRKSR